MRLSLATASLVPFALALTACTQQNEAIHLPGGQGGSSANGPGVTGTGLPCDIVATLQAKCWSCHGVTPSGNAPMALVTHDQLAAPSPRDAKVSNAAASLARMQDQKAPMPPSGALASATELAAFGAWVNAGLPTGVCDPSTSDPYNTPVVCTSGTSWTQGDRGSSRMNPGMACISCHSSAGEGPSLTIAGTVYATAHEPDTCNGGGASVSATQIVITGANGATVTLSPNSVGNFSSRANIALPYTAKLVSNGKERSMSASQMDGDCNGCHTESGANGAPGRVMAP